MPLDTAQIQERLKSLWARLNSDTGAPRARKTSPDWLVLQFWDGGVTVVEAHLGTKLALRRVVEIRWKAGSDPDDSVLQAGLFLKEQLAALHIATTQTMAIVPRDVAVVRRLEVPDVPDDELPDLVRFQAAARTSTPLDRLALDYVPLISAQEAGRVVLLFTIDASRLKMIENVALAAGLQLESVALSPLATAELVSHVTSDARRNAPAIIVWQKGEDVELSLLDQGRVAFSHSIRLSTSEADPDAHVQPLRAELNRALVAMSQSHPDAAIERAVLITGAVADPAVRDLLKTRFPDGLELLDPTGHLDTDELKPDDFPAVVRAVPAIGQLMARQQATLPAIDFKNPRKRYVPPDRRKERMRMAGAGGILALLIGMWWYQSALSARDTEIENLTNSNGTLDAEILGGKPKRDAAKKLQDWEATNARPLSGLAGLAEVFPPADRMYAMNLAVKPATTADALVTITGTCVAKSNEDITAFQDLLSNSGRYRVRARFPTDNKKDLEYPRQFELDIDELKPAPLPAAVAPAAPEAAPVPAAE